VKSPGFFKPRETRTKAQSNYFYFYFIYFLWRKSVEKSPMKTYMVKRAFWKISKKKTKSPHFQEGKKKSFEAATFWGEKKQVLKSLRFVEDLGRFQTFFF
jgi:L-2-hydroxyglutarate oxidase LhgO